MYMWAWSVTIRLDGPALRTEKDGAFYHSSSGEFHMFQENDIPQLSLFLFVLWSPFASFCTVFARHLRLLGHDVVTSQSVMIPQEEEEEEERRLRLFLFNYIPR